MDRRGNGRNRSRSRSRSRSPSSPEKNAVPDRQHRRVDRERLERDRRERMARLRAEIEEEEKRLSGLSRGNNNEFMNGEYTTTSTSQQKSLSAKETIVSVNEEELDGLDEEEQLQKLLGFGGFESTKGRAVEDNQKSLARGAAAKHKARKYRQYMNRKGGFNRPLDKID
mmetsp:Transcript_7130/g.13509  ORF Transcript_7130/g.13509 Transcript_7130/m.13509 type:complete len:169 (-) Transcript_7130:52-558(-)|eukprot:CAMPEP_0176495760 /NCGR_PEP_ID=MMETSP0200_2-20121128/10836_1 /TAXON_ID=947934 /ORGANISM="Chaetoceros sp., Strain GSL56" /LENGTH=168 /DNA_ID=CAMNT_0017893675 /DNA_START=58 /DNA_END=564 /DNA_ORIENTATION=-